MVKLPFYCFCCRTKFCNNSRKTHRTNFMLAVNLQQVNFTKMDYPEQVANIAKRVSKIVGERTLLDYLYEEWPQLELLNESFFYNLLSNANLQLQLFFMISC